MANPKRTDPRAYVPGRAATDSADAHARVPRAWLLGLLAAVLVPWVVVAWVYVTADPREEPPISTGERVAAARGPWGDLVEIPIVISPPLEYVSPEGGRDAPPEWFFPNTTLAGAEQALASVGLPAADIARLRQAARPDPRIDGVVIRPEPAWIRAMPADVRARLYPRLATHPLNFDQEQAFRFRGTSAAQWLGGGGLSPETRALVEPLVYRQGAFLYFADIEAVRAEIRDTAELQRLVKALLRHETSLVRLSVPDVGAVDALAEYWGRGGRRTDIRPLLESVAGAGEDRWIDVVHLLPGFARNHLYRYPRMTAEDFSRPVLANCLWTALNFFNTDPDERYLDPDTALQALRKDYYIIEHGYQLGDVIAFLDPDGDLFHVAVYIADDVTFSKNGTSPMAPWTFMSIAEIKAYYREHAESPRLIFHRRNDL